MDGGIDRFAPSRTHAAITHATSEVCRDGHTLAPIAKIKTAVGKLLGFPVPSDVWNSMPHAELWGEAGTSVALSSYCEASRTIAESVVGRLGPCDAWELTDEIPDLRPAQQDAVKMLLASRVCILTGFPGTGKTHVLAQLAARLPVDIVGSAVLLGPTNLAVRVAATAFADAGVRISSMTAHKFGASGAPDEDPEAEESLSAPILASVKKDKITVVILDEMSMFDERLLAKTLSTAPDDARIWFVGDPYQLPSVMPGAVLRDLLACPAIPRVELTEVMRNSGRITEMCKSIKAKTVPSPSPKIDPASGENWAHIERGTPDEIQAEIVARIAAFRKFDPFWDVQVLSPEKAKPVIGCNALNDALSSALNLHPGRGYEIGQFVKWKLGDKVIHLKNRQVMELTEQPDVPEDPLFDWRPGRWDPISSNWSDNEVVWQNRTWSLSKSRAVNGDIGEALTILDADPDHPSADFRKSRVLVALRDPDRLVLLPLGDSGLEPAYALTTHKMQGGGRPVIVLPLSDSWYFNEETKTGTWSNEMALTAASRSRQFLITVGRHAALGTAIRRVTVDARKTMLTHFLMERTTPRKPAFADIADAF
jgi:exodeoxyribonuclease V alpha subunit